jgi:hypothetical protein
VITDFNKVPRKFLKPDDKKILAVGEARVSIPGVQFNWVKIPITVNPKK